MHYPLKIWINHQGTKFSWSFAKPKNASLSPVGLTRNDRFCHHLFTHASIWKMSPSVYELLPRIPSYHTWRTPLFHENNLGPRAFHLPLGEKPWEKNKTITFRIFSLNSTDLFTMQRCFLLFTLSTCWMKMLGRMISCGWPTPEYQK